MFTLLRALDTGFLKNTFYLQLICHQVSEENIFIPLCFLVYFFFPIKGEAGRNGNPGEMGFSGSPVSLYLSIQPHQDSPQKTKNIRINWHFIVSCAFTLSPRHIPFCHCGTGHFDRVKANSNYPPCIKPCKWPSYSQRIT